MGNTQKLVITDSSKIKKVHFKYPDLLNEDAEIIIKNDYANLMSLKDKLHEYRTRVIELEKAVTNAEKAFREKTHSCTLEFETYEKEYKTTVSNLFIGGQGNDILGTYGN